MDSATPPSSWVERAIVQMKRSDTYQDNAYDGDYETVPVPAWDAHRNWLVIGMGQVLRSRPGPYGTTGATPPRLACVIDWPQATLHWAQGEAVKQVWPARPGLPTPVVPTGFQSNPWDIRVAYFRALSAALERGAFSAAAPADPGAACTAARAARDAFLPAASWELAPFYAAPRHDMDGWIAAHCAKP